MRNLYQSHLSRYVSFPRVIHVLWVDWPLDVEANSDRGLIVILRLQGVEDCHADPINVSCIASGPHGHPVERHWRQVFVTVDWDHIKKEGREGSFKKCLVGSRVVRVENGRLLMPVHFQRYAHLFERGLELVVGFGGDEIDYTNFAPLVRDC